MVKTSQEVQVVIGSALMSLKLNESETRVEQKTRAESKTRALCFYFLVYGVAILERGHTEAAL